MSASNWDTCPRCLDEARQRHEAEVERVASLYGHVPIREFQDAHAALAAVDPDDYRTFREDYEIYGADEGEIVVDYCGSCEQCGLIVSFKERKQFWPAPEASDESGLAL